MRQDWPARLGLWWIAEDHPDLPAVAHSPSGTMTFGELVARANQVTHALRSLDVGPDAVIACVLPNDVDIVVVSLACQQAGWFFLPLNYNLAPDEVATIVEHSGAAVVLIHDTYPEIAAAVVAQDGPARRLSLGLAPSGFEDAGVLFDEQPTATPADRRPGAVFSYTSGTTGKPKGIRRPRPEGDPSAAANDAAIFGRAFGWAPLEGCNLVPAAMHHVGAHSFYIGALNVGQPLAIMHRFEAEECLRLIQDLRVTTAYMVPTMFHRLLQLPDEVRERYDHSTLQSVVHSAAPCPRAVKEKMMAWWGPVIWETYGGSEGAATIAKPYRWLEKPGTVGRSVRGVKVWILDDDGNEVPRGDVGNVYIEMDARPFEYHGDDAGTEQVFNGRRFTIGDVGYLDEDGYLFLRDRAKDMIISGGVNVYPAEVESSLSGHPAVGDVAVIGVPNDEWGEEIRAIVRVADGYVAGDALARELLDHCRQHLARFKCPRAVDFRDELPRTDAGKLYKRLLREEYWAAARRAI